jgi:hypothetical protein
MKTSCVTLLSLLLVVAQVWFASVNAAAALEGRLAAPGAGESCCDGPKTHHCSCCVGPSESRPSAGPIAPAPANSNPLPAGPLSADLTVLWWLPPPPVVEPIPVAESPSSTLAAVPLFLRHGALLL